MNMHDIPAELLLYIFTTIAKDPPDKDDPVVVGTVLSGVCRRWRELATSSQELWSTLPRRSATFTDLCLTRCTTAPLNVVIETLFLRMEDRRLAFRAIYPHCSRVKRLSLTVHESRLYRYETYPIELSELADAFQAQLPDALEDLALKLVTYPGDAHGPPQHMPTEISGALLPPSLRLFACRNAILPHDLHLKFTNLRHVDFVRVEAWHNVEGMVAFFQSMPLLESFSHTNFISKNIHSMLTPGALPAPRSVRMKHLREFKMVGLTVCAFAAFSCLDFPPSATLIIKDDDPGFSNEFILTSGLQLTPRYRQFLARASSALHHHFAGAIARQVHYDAVRLDEDVISPLVAHSESSNATIDPPYDNVLPTPGNLELQLPSIAGFDTPDYFPDLGAEIAKYILPIFSAASVVELGDWVEPCETDAFTSARTMILKSASAMESFSHGPCRTSLEHVHVVGVDFSESESDEVEGCVKVAARLRDVESEARLTLAKGGLSEQVLENIRGILVSRVVISED
ncbi:unnamed protein product [Peniophora sp. CBMAI 1063]|nr:unnamed protein product [Peniophora sp. CBMAI 1063]